ncbi:hypothetical protein NBRC116592_30530 [Colwellia sp. KU-HH00111]
MCILKLIPSGISNNYSNWDDKEIKQGGKSFVCYMLNKKKHTFT